MNKILKHIPIIRDTNSSVIGLLAHVGSRNESLRYRGISHFIEHLLFKGSKKRTCQQISQAIEQYGGVLNAFTSEEVTCYWMKIANDYLDYALDVLTEFVQNPIFDEKEINKEREVIIQELNMYKDNPVYYIWDLFNRIYFPQKHSLHFPIVGTPQTLYNIDKSIILDYYNQNYTHLTMLTIGKEPNKIYKNLLSPRVNNVSDSLTKNADIQGIFESRKNLSQANILIGNYVNAYGVLDYYYKFALLSEIMNDMSGRLFNTVREKNNLCYRIHFNYQFFKNKFVQWAVSIGLDTSQIKKAQQLILSQLTKPITENELIMAKQKYIGGLSLSLDNNYNLMNKIITIEQLGLSIDYNTILTDAKQYINNISLNEFLQFQKRLDFEDNLIVGVIPEK